MSHTRFYHVGRCGRQTGVMLLLVVLVAGMARSDEPAPPDPPTPLPDAASDVGPPPQVVPVAVPAAVSGSGLFTNLYGDMRAHRVGDTLHLIVVETTSAKVNADQTSGQKTDTKFGPGVGKLSFLPLLGVTGTTQSTATGNTTRGGSMSARMTVRISAITPQGNLVVEGERGLSVNSDREVIRIRGEVRPRDVRPDNTIYSYDLANVHISYTGSDPRKPARKVGIITRLLNLLF